MTPQCEQRLTARLRYDLHGCFLGVLFKNIIYVFMM